MIHLLIRDRSVAYPDPRTGNHKHLEANSLVELEDAVAHELVFPAKAAQYIDPDDVPERMRKVKELVASPADLQLAKSRREYAERAARARAAA